MYIYSLHSHCESPDAADVAWSVRPGSAAAVPPVFTLLNILSFSTWLINPCIASIVILDLYKENAHIFMWLHVNRPIVYTSIWIRDWDCDLYLEGIRTISVQNYSSQMLCTPTPRIQQSFQPQVMKQYHTRMRLPHIVIASYMYFEF